MTRTQLTKEFQKMIDLREQLYIMGEQLREKIGLDKDASILDQIRDGEITDAGYAVRICENDYDIQFSESNDEWQTKWEALKSELFANGMYAIDDFIGYECPYNDKDTIDNLLDEIAEQMPDEIMDVYFNKYLPNMEEQQERD